MTVCKLGQYCVPTQVLNSDKAAINTISGNKDDSIIVTCNPGWSGTKVTVCGLDKQWSPVVKCTVNACTPRQVSNSNKAAANSITGTSYNFFF